MPKKIYQINDNDYCCIKDGLCNVMSKNLFISLTKTTDFYLHFYNFIVYRVSHFTRELKEFTKRKFRMKIERKSRRTYNYFKLKH